MILFTSVVFVGVVWASPGIQTGKASSFYVRNSPGISAQGRSPEMHAGRLEVGSKMGLDGNSSLFFWHFRATQPSNKTIIWFNGGPGCSSMDGALMEVGPFRFDSETADSKNVPKGAWSEVTNMSFLDQPFGTGFSDPEDSSWVTSLEQAADAVSLFSLEYAEVFPELLDTDIILAGESFAGQYIPHVYQSIQRNVEVQSKIKISGLVLINPWIDPANQYLSYVPFIKKNGLLPSSDFATLDQLQNSCIEELSKGNHGFSVSSCESITDYLSTHYVNPETNKRDKKKCYNAYDVSLESPSPSCGLEWPPSLPKLSDWLSRSDVRKALHAPVPSEDGDGFDNDSPWQECSSAVHQHMKNGEISRNFLPKISESVPLLSMVGMNDYVCNYMGLDRMVENSEWNGGVGFDMDSSGTSDSWGTYTSERNLAMAHVQNASHMVPYDHLEASQMVLHRWFHDIGLENDDEYAKHSPDQDQNNSGDSNQNTESPTDPSQQEGNPDNEQDGSKDSDDQPSQEAINQAVSAAYRKAGVVALVIVLVVVAILGAVWWFRGHRLSATMLVHALLHSNMKISDQKDEDYVPLREFHRRPSAIPEAEDEVDDFEV